MTIRSRCRLVTLRTPPADGGRRRCWRRDGVDPERRAGRGPRRAGPRRPGAAAGPRPGRPRPPGRGAGDPGRRSPRSGPAFEAADRARRRRPRRRPTAVTEDSTSPRREALQPRSATARPARARPPRSAACAGAMKDLEKRQKSRATRTKRDALDRALRRSGRVLPRRAARCSSGAPVELANPDFEATMRCGRPGARRRRPTRCAGSTPSCACREALELNVKPRSRSRR